jgi:transposase-like protein
MYIQEHRLEKSKQSARKLCGHSFSASAISGFNKKLHEELGRFAPRELDGEYPYLIPDARYEKVNAVIRSRAVLVAIGIDLGGPAPGARSRNGQPGESDELERLSSRTQDTRTAGRHFRGE